MSAPKISVIGSPEPSRHRGRGGGSRAGGSGRWRAPPPDVRLYEPVPHRSGASDALLRYNSAVATIQIREVPEESYEVLRRRARQAGQSIQAYMRDEIVAIAARPTKREAIEMIEAILDRTDGPDPTTRSVLGDLAVERR